MVRHNWVRGWLGGPELGRGAGRGAGRHGAGRVPPPRDLARAGAALARGTAACDRTPTGNTNTMRVYFGRPEYSRSWHSKGV